MDIDELFFARVSLVRVITPFAPGVRSSFEHIILPGTTRDDHIDDA